MAENVLRTVPTVHSASVRFHCSFGPRWAQSTRSLAGIISHASRLLNPARQAVDAAQPCRIQSLSAPAAISSLFHAHSN